MPSDTDHLERLLTALAQLDAASQANIDRSLEIQRRIRSISDQIQSGTSLVEIVRSEDGPRIVELLSANTTTLNTVGADLRAAKALALRKEGLTTSEIADIFGVTRQRISALLRQRAADDSRPEPA